MNAAPAENPKRERERVVVFSIMPAVGAIALAYGILTEHPPAGMILSFILVGAIFTAAMLLAKHSKYRFLVYLFAYGFAQESFHYVERIFVKRPCESPWVVLVAEFGAFCLGSGAAFAIHSLTRKAACDGLEQRA